MVRGKCPGNLPLLHKDEADAVGEAPVLVFSLPKQPKPLAKKVGGDMNDFQVPEAFRLIDIVRIPGYLLIYPHCPGMPLVTFVAKGKVNIPIIGILYQDRLAERYPADMASRAP